MLPVSDYCCTAHPLFALLRHCSIESGGRERGRKREESVPLSKKWLRFGGFQVANDGLIRPIGLLLKLSFLS